MPSNSLKILLILLFNCWEIAASNRADVNADQDVDATDLAELSHVLAGNLSLADYDLANVVVVALQGGDFSDPADAADWVTSQGPSTNDPYVILVTPGRYPVDRAVELPGFTTLMGQGTRNCTIVRNASGIPEDSAVVVVRDCIRVEINSISFENHGSGTTTGTFVTGIYALDSSINFRDISVVAMGTGGFSCGIYLERTDSISRSVSLDACHISAVGISDLNGGTCAGIYNDSYAIQINASEISASNSTSGQDSFGITNNKTDYEPSSKAYYCQIRAGATGAGSAYYMHRKGGSIHPILLNCIVAGDNFGTVVHWNCCDPNGNPVP